jgi:hypothetical protein
VKRVFSILISLCTIVSAYADGDVIEIWTASDLKAFSLGVNDGNTYSGKTVKLMADITIVSDDHWIPIGQSEQRWDEEHSVYVKDESRVFKGTFDGQGYTITMSTSSNRAVAGLFGYLYGTVQHLKVTGSVVNSYKVGDVTYTSSTGGIAAYNRGTISECANLASIVGVYAGGIAGENHGIITNCYNRGAIGADATFTGEKYLGGIAGANDGTGATISNVYACCNIDNVSSHGGIVANNISGTISNFDYAASGTTTLQGDALKGVLDNSIWTFTEGQLPELTCFKNKIVRLSDNNDNSAILTNYNGQTRTVELSGRTLYKDGAWNTLCLPFDIDLTNTTNPLYGDDVVAKVLDGNNTSLNAAGLLSLTFTSATTILAGTPFIIKWKNTGVHLSNVQFNNVTIDKTAPTPVTFSNAFGSAGQFVGTYSPFYITSANIGTIVLLSSGNKLGYSATTPRTLHSCRAHFLIPTSAGIRAMTDFDIDLEGEATGITNTDLTDGTDDIWYTLTGMKLDGKPTQRGVYLHNGRKEAVR